MKGRRWGAPLLLLFLLLAVPFLHAGLKWYPPKHADGPIVGAPIVTKSYAAAVSSTGSVYIIDMVSGEQPFPYSLGEPTSVPPVLGKKYLVVGTDSGRIEAIDVDSGRLAWKYERSGKNATAPGGTGTIRQAVENTADASVKNTTLLSLAAMDGRVFASFQDKLVALDENTGKEVWLRPGLGSGGYLSAGAGMLFLSSGDTLYAYSADGQLAWQQMVGNLFKTRPGVSAEKKLVAVGTTGGQVVARDIKSGLLRWVYEVPGWVMSTPRVVGENVVFGTNTGDVIALNADSGQLAWKQHTGGPVWAEPLGVGDGGSEIAIVGSNDGHLYAFSAFDGRQVWRYPTSDWTFGAATSDGKEIVAGSQDGTIWVLSVSPMCTISNFENGQLVGDKFGLSGQAFAFRGARTVDIRVGPIQIPRFSAGESWSIMVDASSLPEGPLEIYCSATDTNNLEEASAGPKVHLIKSLQAPKQKMTLTMSQAAEPDSNITVWVRDGNGYDLDNVMLAVGENTLVVKSPHEFSVPSAEGQYAVKASKAGFDAAEGSLAVRKNQAPLVFLILIVAAALAAAAVAYKLVLKR